MICLHYVRFRTGCSQILSFLGGFAPNKVLTTGPHPFQAARAHRIFRLGTAAAAREGKPRFAEPQSYPAVSMHVHAGGVRGGQVQHGKTCDKFMGLWESKIDPQQP